MFFLTALLGLAFAEEIQEDELVVSSKGRLILLRPDNTWEEVPSEKSVCLSRVEKGQTEKNGYTFRARGDLFLTKGKAFSYILTSHPDQSEAIIVELFHKKGTFQGPFNILFEDNHFFRNLEFERVKVPHKGWSFRFQKDIQSPLITDMRTKYVHSFENHKYKQFRLAEFSAKDFRSRMQCLYESVYTYLNSPQSFKNKETLEKQRQEEALKKQEETIQNPKETPEPPPSKEEEKKTPNKPL
ncbi:MAG: hypothetical protein CL916_07185 [Deltaproteobacteria bacterium]|nr:hypothetical protein [Deltaproteobacteria bacterium]